MEEAPPELILTVIVFLSDGLSLNGLYVNVFLAVVPNASHGRSVQKTEHMAGLLRRQSCAAWLFHPKFGVGIPIEGDECPVPLHNVLKTSLSRHDSHPSSTLSKRHQRERIPNPPVHNRPHLSRPPHPPGRPPPAVGAPRFASRRPHAMF